MEYWCFYSPYVLIRKKLPALTDLWWVTRLFYSGPLLLREKKHLISAVILSENLLVRLSLCHDKNVLNGSPGLIELSVEAGYQSKECMFILALFKDLIMKMTTTQWLLYKKEKKSGTHKNHAFMASCACHYLLTHHTGLYCGATCWFPNNCGKSY